MKRGIEWWAALFTVVGFPLLIISVGFAYTLDGRLTNQLNELIKVASSQNTIALDTMFFNDPTNIGIIADIDKGKKILVENGGQFSDSQLDKYLGDYDTVNLIYKEGLLSEQQLCNSFSYYLSKAAQDSEITAYLKKPGNADADFTDLMNTVNHSQNSDCHS